LTFRWSNSVQAWHERVGDLFLAVGGVTAAALGLLAWQGALDWPLWLVVLAMAGLVAPALILHRAGWLKVFGPVLYYDMIRQARRSRFIVLRVLYALLLVFLLFCVAFPRMRQFQANTHEASTIAQTYFEVFMVAQFITVGLLTPAYVAGAIAEEKDRRTLEFMLATDLLNREIVLSKLGSRLANLGLIVLTGLPILSILQFLGGVDPNMVLAGFIVTSMTIVGQAGVSILCSVIASRPREAIALAYLGVVMYYVLALLLWLAITPFLGNIGSTPVWFGANPPTFADFVWLYNRGNLVAVIIEVQRAGFGGTLASDLPGIVRGYVIFHGLLALATASLAIARIRRVFLVQTYGKSRKTRRAVTLWGRPAVGSFPMLWKEIHCEGNTRTNWIAWSIFTVLLSATFVPAGLIIYYALRDFYAEVRPYDNIATHMNAWVRVCNVVVGCLTLLAVAVRASTVVSSERDKQTLDTLLTTPLDSSSIFYAKWVGSILGARFGILWLAAIWAIGIVTGGLHIAALLLVMAAWLVYAGFLATLGMWFSTICKTTLRATVLTILSTIILSLGHWLPWMCCLALPTGPMGRMPEHAAKAQAGLLTPPFVMGWLAFSSQDLDVNRGRGMRDSEWWEVTGLSLAGLVLWSAATAGLYVVASTQFRRVTHRQSYIVPDFGWQWDADRDRAARRRRRARGLPVAPWAPPPVSRALVDEEDADEPLDHEGG
jgi:ABC-type transport system involved in multi-copper enzyme maturation permease subunit